MTNKKQRLVIGIPSSSGLVDWRFTSSLMSLQMIPDTRLVWTVRTMIDSARNMLVEEALKDPNSTHLLMVDDDMTFDSDFALKLLEHDVDIVGGLAFKRRENFTPCVFKKKEEKKLFDPILPEVFQEVDAIGTGGILIKLDVFKKLKYPWFETTYDKEGIHWSVDLDFCIKAKKAGYKIFVDPDASMGHIGSSPIINKETFLRHVEKVQQTKS